MTRFNTVTTKVIPVAELAKKPEVHVLIDASIVVQVEVAAMIDAKHSCPSLFECRLNSKLAKLIGNIVTQAEAQGAVVNLHLFGKQSEIQNKLISYWDNANITKKEVAVKVNIDSILKVFNEFIDGEITEKNIIGFEADKNNEAVFSEKILLDKCGNSFKPQQLICLSNCTQFLSAMSLYGASIVRFANVGEIDRQAFEQFKEQLACRDAKYAIRHLFVDIDGTMSLGEIAAYQPHLQTIINPYLVKEMQELKPFNFSASVLTARQAEFNYEIKIKGMVNYFERLKNNLENVLSDLKKIADDLAVDQKSSQNKDIIEDLNRDYKFIIDNLKKIKEQIDKGLVKGSGLYEDLKKMLTFIGSSLNRATLFCNRAMFLARQQQNMNARKNLHDLQIELREQVQQDFLSAQMYFFKAFTLSTSHIVSCFKEQTGVALELKQESYLNTSKTKRNKIESIREFVRPYIGKGQAVLIGFIDDNMHEIAAAQEAIPELEKQGVKLIVIPVYHIYQLYQQPQPAEEQAFIAGHLQNVIDECREHNSLNFAKLYNQRVGVCLFKSISQVSEANRRDSKPEPQFNEMFSRVLDHIHAVKN